jgi:hypothetical protein
MQRIYTFLITTLSIPIISAQYCTNIGPTSSIDSNVKSVLLAGEVGTINYTGCPGVIGLQDLTSFGTTLNAGSNYTAQILFGTCGGNYAGAGEAWIDFDQSGIFEPSESIGTWQGTPPATLSAFNFQVPSGSQNGLTRMRIIQQEGGSLPIDPCATFSWGSAMDFSITIGNGIDCSGYIGDNTSDPIIVSTLPYTNSGDNSFCYANDNLVYNSPDIYYELAPSPLMQSITVSLCGSTFDTFLSVVDPFGNIIAYNDDAEGCGTQSALTFNTNGLGLCYIIVEGWGNASGEFNIEINAEFLSINNLNNEEITILPNPTSDYFALKGIAGNINIYDLAGKVVKSVSNYNGEQIAVSDIQSGIYLVKYSINNRVFSTKLMVR